MNLFEHNLKRLLKRTYREVALPDEKKQAIMAVVNTHFSRRQEAPQPSKAPTLIGRLRHFFWALTPATRRERALAWGFGVTILMAVAVWTPALVRLRNTIRPLSSPLAGEWLPPQPQVVHLKGRASLVRVAPKSRLRFLAPSTSGDMIELTEGCITVTVIKGQGGVSVVTPAGRAVAKGTRFEVKLIKEGQEMKNLVMLVAVLTGFVEVVNPLGQVMAQAGETVRAATDEKPRVRPVKPGSPTPVARWRKLESEEPFPARFQHTATFDPPRGRLLVVGGQGPGARQGDTWVLNLTTEQWHEVESDEALPPRDSHSATLDPYRQRLIVVGGNDGRDQLGDTWSLDLRTGQWSEVESKESLPPRQRHTATLDPVGQRLVIVGGNWGSGEAQLDDVWSLDLKTDQWREIESDEALPPRRWHTATLDPYRQRLIVAGGRAEGGHISLSDTWMLDLKTGQWHEQKSGEEFPGRWGHTTTLDPVGHRLVVVGGLLQGGGVLRDSWVLDLIPKQGKVRRKKAQ